MSTQVGPDNYGRSVMQTITGNTAFYQVYADMSNASLLFSVSIPNLNLVSAMSTINSMATSDPAPPPPTAVVLYNVTEDPPAPGRALNAPFMVNAFYATMVYYTVQISATCTIGSNQSGKVDLLCDSRPNPSTIRGTVYNANAVSLAAVLQATNTHQAVLSYLVPPGHYVNLRTTGDAAITLAGQSEQVIQQ